MKENPFLACDTHQAQRLSQTSIMSRDHDPTQIMPPFRQRVLGKICSYDWALYMALILLLMLTVLAVLSYMFAPLDPETHAILMINFVLLFVVGGITISLIYICGRYHR